jgi:hypothetical protein
VSTRPSDGGGTSPPQRARPGAPRDALKRLLAKGRRARTEKIRCRSLKHLDHAIRDAGPALSLEWVRRDPDLAYFWQGAEDPTWQRITRRRGNTVEVASDRRLRELLAHDELAKGAVRLPPPPWGDTTTRRRRWRAITVLLGAALAAGLLWRTPHGGPEIALFGAGAILLAMSGRRWFIAYFEWRLEKQRTRWRSRRRSSDRPAP